MSDYQRFISYIYEYKNQEKAQNCGFSKVEFRNNQCRLEIHMKPGPYPYNPEFQVYTFIPVNNKLKGISLGSAHYQQGALNGVFIISQKTLANHSCTFKDLGGILIQADTGQIFASAWKDYEIRPADFTLEDPEETDSESQEAPIHAASTENYIPESTESDFPSEITEQPVNFTSPARSNRPTNITVPDTFNQPVNFTTPDTFNQPVNFTAPDTSNQPVNFTTPDTSNQPVNNTVPDNSYQPTNHSTSGYSRASHNNTPSDTSTQRIFPMDYWVELQQTYPQVHPFFDDEIHNCIQFSTNDWDYLSTLGFSMNNNRFFQHACDNFHHFLIGFTSQENLPVLAIPGIYSELEYYLASAFGFPYFKTARNESNFPGQFVYWLKPL